MQTAEQYKPLHEAILTTKKLLESLTTTDQLAPKKRDSLMLQLANLSQALKKNDIDELPHEFYEEISSLIRVITELRRKEAFKTADSQKIINAFDTLTILVRAMIYQLPILPAENITFPLDALRTTISKTKDAKLIKQIQALTPLSDLAMQHSDHCAKDADVATDKATKLLEKMQQAFDKGKAPDLELQQQAFEQSLNMYVSNTAATIAVDEATAVSMYFDNTLQQAEKQLKK